MLEGFFRQLVKRERQRQKDNAELLHDGGKQLEVLIGKLAWSMAEQTQISMPCYETLTIMGHEEAWLKLAIRCNVLEQIGDYVRFSHQLLQDYFIAIGMKKRLDEGQLDAEQFWRHNWWEPTGWEEPVILLAGLYDDCNPVVSWLKTANPKLAARCINESGVPCHDATRAELYKPWEQRLSNLESDPHPYARAAIGDALALVDLHGRSLDQRKGVGLDDKGLPDIDWVEIPAGEFIYQDGEKLVLETYWMSHYPVTNEQFQAFMSAKDGYQNDEWWQELNKPESLHESYWKSSNRPVEQVDWYEAMAFCRWLKAKTGLEITLPTEQQWEKAARGTNGFEYPWGEGYQSGYANINETMFEDGDYYLEETSAVGIYPQGKSPFGLIDMTGNVWEWCLNKHGEPDMIAPDLSGDSLVVRGGSWFNLSVNCRSAYRIGWPPDSRDNNQGFRLCCLFSPNDH